MIDCRGWSDQNDGQQEKEKGWSKQVLLNCKESKKSMNPLYKLSTLVRLGFVQLYQSIMTVFDYFRTLFTIYESDQNRNFRGRSTGTNAH